MSGLLKSCWRDSETLSLKLERFVPPTWSRIRPRACLLSIFAWWPLIFPPFVSNCDYWICRRMTTIIQYDYLLKCLSTICVTRRTTAPCICLRVLSTRNAQLSLCSATTRNHILLQEICSRLYDCRHYVPSSEHVLPCCYISPFCVFRLARAECHLTDGFASVPSVLAPPFI